MTDKVPDHKSPSNHRPKRRLQFNLKSLVVAISWVAVCAALLRIFSWQGLSVLVAIGLTLAFSDRRTRIATVVVSLVVLLPFTWVFWYEWDKAWPEYRWTWVSMWPSLPGLIGSRLMLGANVPDWAWSSAASLVTLGVLATGIAIGRAGKIWLIGVAILYSVIFLFIGYGTYGAFRA